MGREITDKERLQIEQRIREALGIPELKASDLVGMQLDPSDALQMIQTDEDAFRAKLRALHALSNLG